MALKLPVSDTDRTGGIFIAVVGHHHHHQMHLPISMCSISKFKPRTSALDILFVIK